MLRPRIRASITAADLAALEALIARQAAGRRAVLGRVLAARGLDAVFAHPDGDLEVLLTPGTLCPFSLPLYLYAHIHRALDRVGLTNAEVSDYVTTVVVEFGEGTRADRLNRLNERSITTLSDAMVAEAEGQADAAEHCGNLALWLAGLFPDRIEQRVQRRGAPGLAYFDAMGAQGYARAAAGHAAQAVGQAALYDELAQAFVRVRRALNLVADRCAFSVTADPVARLLRQVARA